MAGRNLLAQPVQPQAVEPVAAPAQGRNLLPQQVASQPVQPPQQQGFLSSIGSAIAGANRGVNTTVNAITSAVTGGDRRTLEGSAARELIDAPIRDIGGKIGFNLALNFDSAEIEQVVKEQFGEESVRKDDKGNSFVTVNGEEFVLNAPGLSKQDIGATIGNIISFLPAARVSALGQTVAKRLGLGAISSGVTQTGIETAEAATGGEFSPGEVASATVFGALGEIPSAIKQTQRLTPDAATLLPQVSPEQAELARRTKAETGISILPSQATEAQQDALVNVVLARDPTVGPKFTARLKEQSQDAFGAVTNMLDMLATSDEAAAAALDIRNTSVEAISAARKSRTKETAPMFRSAFDQANEAGLVLDTTAIVSSLNDQIDLASGAIKKELLILRNTVMEATNPSKLGSNVEKLKNAQLSIANQADTLKVNNALDKKLETSLNDTRTAIRDQLVNEVPGFNEANELFKELSPAVDLIKEGVGNIAKIPDDKLANVRRQLFNWQEFNANPQSIRSAKRVIEGANPEAWNAILRNKLSQDLAEVGVETATDATDANFNFIQQFWSKSLKGKDKALMMQALDGDGKKNFNALSEAFQRTRVRPQQSATVQLADITTSLDGKNGVPGTIDAILNPLSSGVFSKVFGSPQVRENNIRLLSDILLDPKWWDRLSEIRMLGMETPKGGAAFAQLFRTALQEDQQ